MNELQPVICRQKRNGCVAVSHRVEGAGECPVELCVAAATGHAVMPAEDAAQRATGELPVQGDVGCGKTVVAAMSMLASVDAKKQAALMAPTEILAKQHVIVRWGIYLGAIALVTVLGVYGPGYSATQFLYGQF